MAPADTKLESDTRAEIDNKLIAAGWVVQDKKRINLYESLGVAVREMDTDTGPADYMLFIDGKACGIIEAKREGSELGGVADQSERYATSHSKHIERWVAANEPLPFIYEATNHEIRFRDERDPHSRSITDECDAHGCANVAGGRTPRATHRTYLTATPTKKTIGFFNQNLVSEYTHEDAVTGAKRRKYLMKPEGILKCDMIATGTDIRPLECVMFMRDVTEAQRRKSLTKPEGVLKGKSRFVLVDCVGVCESVTNNQNQTNSNYNTAYLRAA